jgi:hypothetical protein
LDGRGGSRFFKMKKRGREEMGFVEGLKNFMAEIIHCSV